MRQPALLLLRPTQIKFVSTFFLEGKILKGADLPAMPDMAGTEKGASPVGLL